MDTKHPRRILLSAFLLFQASALSAAPPSDSNTYVEFLWSRPSPDALARQETRGFLLGNSDHRVCVAAINPPPGGVASLRIDAVDAAGKLASRQDHDDFRGAKQCYPAELGTTGQPGEWTFNIYINQALAATKQIEVARSLETATFYAPSLTPYVLGRPNYDATLDPDKFVGRLVWIMSVDKRGTVTRVDIESTEGVGAVMRDRAIAAGYMSLFPPDPLRAEGATYRRELNFDRD